MPGPGINSLDQASVTTLKGVGPAFADKLARLGIHTLADVLFHLPMRYEDRSRVTPIARARLGQQVVIEGEVVEVKLAFGRRRSLLAYLKDDTGMIALRFFHFSRPQQKNLENAGTIRCFGEVRRGAAGFEIYHPEYTSAAGNHLDNTLTPVYPATEGLTQQRMRGLVEQVLSMMDAGKLLPELLPSTIVPMNMGINEAIGFVHRPPPDADMIALMEGRHPAQQRLAFEELLGHHTSMRLVREEVSRLRTYALTPPGKTCKAFTESLGFDLTGAQTRVASEIANDMSKPVPMLRLLQGDVGSGKTVIAALAAIQAVENGLQAAIMAPTEILAEQHFINFSGWLSPLGITTTYLSGKVKGSKRAEQLALMKSGTAGVIIGTHALFQKEVKFKKLGLIVIDEQHRFGVHQRLALREKGE
ncbi:MAG: DEAD/DEAH box helicase, partial [Pseudomonadales bacterium]